MDKITTGMNQVQFGQTGASAEEKKLLNQAFNPEGKEYPTAAKASKGEKSYVDVMDYGRVTKVLSDRESGAPGIQMFYLKADSGPLVQVYHVKTISPEIPDLKPGQRLGVKGSFILNDEGSKDKFAGIITATHKNIDNGGHEDGGIVVLEKGKNFGKVIS